MRLQLSDRWRGAAPRRFSGPGERVAAAVLVGSFERADVVRADTSGAVAARTREACGGTEVAGLPGRAGRHRAHVVRAWSRPCDGGPAGRAPPRVAGSRTAGLMSLSVGRVTVLADVPPARERSRVPVRAGRTVAAGAEVPPRGLVPVVSLRPAGRVAAGSRGPARFVRNLGLRRRCPRRLRRPGRGPTLGLRAQAAPLTEARAANPSLAAGSQTLQQQACATWTGRWHLGHRAEPTHRRPTWCMRGAHEGFRVVGRHALRVREDNHHRPGARVLRAGWTRPAPS